MKAKLHILTPWGMLKIVERFRRDEDTAHQAFLDEINRLNQKYDNQKEQNNGNAPARLPRNERAS